MDAETDCVVRAVAAIVAGRTDVGAYLHGSRARGEARATSDIDLLVLADDTVDDDAGEALERQIAGDVGDLTVDLDLKVIPAARFAPDPWVDLTRAQWIAGRRWHDELPPQKPDDLAHESLGVLRVLQEDRAFDGHEGPVELRKSVGRLATILAAIAGARPRGGREAMSTVRTLSGRAAEAVTAAWEALDDDEGPSRSDVDLAEHALAAVLGEIAAARADGRLGPRAAEAAVRLHPAGDAAAGEAAMNVGAAFDTARGCFERLLTTDELRTLELRVVHPDDDHRVDSSTPADSSLRLDFSVVGERGGCWLFSGETRDAFVARLTDELQTFIAESGFGWGQWREPSPAG